MHSTHYISAWRRYGARGVLLNLLERICACVRIEVRHMTLLAHPLERVTPAEPLPVGQHLCSVLPDTAVLVPITCESFHDAAVVHLHGPSVVMVL